MGELYGGANEARFATDIMGIFRWMEGIVQRIKVLWHLSYKTHHLIL